LLQKKLMELTLKSYLEWIEKGKFSSEEVMKNYLARAKEGNKDYFAFLRFYDDYIEKNLTIFADKPLRWAPIGMKDNVLTKGLVTSFGSKIAENYVSPYSATFFEKLEDAGGLMIWKTNMDEFAMGSSTETSTFGKTLNCYGTNRVPGGSSWGSAVAVAADLCLAAFWTDTAGSVRQPAALCGVVWFKPTYGRISRYGIQPMANSLDQVGMFTKTVEDTALLFSYVSWYDSRDAQSIDKKFVLEECNFALSNLNWYKIALPTEFISEGLDPEIKSQLLVIIERLRKAGAQVDEVSLPTLEYVLPIYYTLMPAELSTNLSRFDGIRFGLQKNSFDFENILEYYKAVRSAGFWEETKRRIMVGTYVLSSEHYESYFIQAQKAQAQMQKEFATIFEKYDLVIGSTTPGVAWKIGEKIDDPIKMYLSDIYTVSANICGLPGISVPAGFVEDRWEKMPWGVHLMADRWKEKKIFEVGNWIEKNVKWKM